MFWVPGDPGVNLTHDSDRPGDPRADADIGDVRIQNKTRAEGGMPLLNIDDATKRVGVLKRNLGAR